MPAKSGFTPKRERFAQEIVRGLSQADAYRLAFNASSMKPETVHKRASELMANGWVTGRVAELAAAVEREVVVETADLLRESMRVAFSDIRQVMTPDGKVRLPQELDADTARAVASFKIDEYGRIEYKFWDKNSAMERLFKHKGLFEKDNRQKADPLVELLQGLGGNVVGPVADPEDGDQV